jgi:hypothetical protein
VRGSEGAKEHHSLFTGSRPFYPPLETRSVGLLLESTRGVVYGYDPLHISGVLAIVRTGESKAKRATRVTELGIGNLSITCMGKRAYGKYHVELSYHYFFYSCCLRWQSLISLVPH